MIKHLLITILCILQFAFCNLHLLQAQNLVPNPSFEDYTTCPNDYGQIGNATGWIDLTSSCDYYNSCSSGFNASVPYNSMGYQNPVNVYCHGYAGIYCYGPYSNYREYFGIKLNSPLIIGGKYYMSINVSLANNCNCGIDKIGLIFSNAPMYNSTIITHFKNYANLFSSNIIKDTINWTRIFGTFVADSNYDYINIGNFFDDTITNTFKFNSYNCTSYYYIDDICVSTDSAYCFNYSYSCGEGIANYEESNITIYPNPVNSVLHITSENIQDYNLKVYNAIGELILQSDKLSSNSEVDLTQYPEGMYFLQVYSNNKIFNKKIIIEK